MKKTLALFACAAVSFASQSLPIVKYDPFYKAQKILQSKTKTSHTAAKRKKSPPKLHLTAILNDKAYINGNFYKVGDTVASFEVVKISSDSVHLKKGSKITILRFERAKQHIQTTQVERVQ